MVLPTQSSDQDKYQGEVLRKRSPFKFFLLVLALSIPIWLIGSFTTLQILPGLPVSSLAIIVPMTAALVLVFLEEKTPGMKNLLLRSFDFKRVKNKLWYLPNFLLMPAVMVLSFYILRWMGSPIPPPQISVLTVLAMLVGFFFAGLGEELGWTGYAIDPLQDRFGAFWASLILGVVGSFWHVIPLLQVDRSPGWIAWWCLGTVTQRVLIVWLYNNMGKSVSTAAIFHSTVNLTWQLFPINGSFYDPQVTSLIIVFFAFLVTLIWRPGRLARSRTSTDSLDGAGT